MRTAKSCGPDAPTLASVKFCGVDARTVKTIAQGRPDVPANLWFLTCVLTTLAHEAAVNSDASCRENAAACLEALMRDNPGELFAIQAFPITAKTLYGAHRLCHRLR
jgi:hypothetical protein